MKLTTVRHALRREIIALVIGVMVVSLLAIPAAHAEDNAQGGGPLAYFVTAGGALDDEVFVHEWTFEARADQVVSLIAQAVSGDLDPILTVFGPGGTQIAENDDLDSLVRDAGLEALTLPSDGTYSVQVSRYDGALGATQGSYRLTLTPGFAQVVRSDSFDQGTVSWVSPSGTPVALSGGWLRMPVPNPGVAVIALPPVETTYTNLYLQADARLFADPSYGEFGLIFRVQGAGAQLSYYEFRVNSDGEWSVIWHEPNGEFLLRTWASHPALDASGVTLGVLVREDTFTFFADGQRLGAVEDARLTGTGKIGVIASSLPDQEDIPTAMFDNVIVTTRLGTTYRGMPLALATWDSDYPAAITGELADAGQITPAQARDLFITDKVVSAQLLTPEAQFELLGHSTTEYGDFVLGATTSAITVGESTGCGVVFRWLDERNFSMVYTDQMGGWGITQAQDGQLSANAYDLSPMVQPDGLNDLLVIAQGDLLTLYINGALVAQEPVSAATGRVGVAMLNYEAAQTDCHFFNVWVWPLIG